MVALLPDVILGTGIVSMIVVVANTRLILEDLKPALLSIHLALLALTARLHRLALVPTLGTGTTSLHQPADLLPLISVHHPRTTRLPVLSKRGVGTTRATMLATRASMITSHGATQSRLRVCALATDLRQL
jgi:hypothetical protein